MRVSCAVSCTGPVTVQVDVVLGARRAGSSAVSSTTPPAGDPVRLRVDVEVVVVGLSSGHVSSCQIAARDSWAGRVGVGRVGGSAQIVGWPTNISAGGAGGGPGGLERAPDGPGADQPAQQRGSRARARAGRSPWPARARRRPGWAARASSGSGPRSHAAKRSQQRLAGPAPGCGAPRRATSRAAAAGDAPPAARPTRAWWPAARRSSRPARAAGRRAGTAPARSRPAGATADPGTGGRRSRS